MKKEIIAYINALIDTCNTTVNIPVVKSLINLLNFVEKIPADTDEKSKRYIELVEKICDNFKEKNCELVQEVQILKKDIAVQELNNMVWQNTYNELKEENKKYNMKL